MQMLKEPGEANVLRIQYPSSKEGKVHCGPHALNTTKARKVKPASTVLLIATALCTALPAQESRQGRQVYTDNAASVLLLYVKSPDGEFIAQGTGFCVGGQKIITNAHVANAGKIYVQLGPARVPARLERVDASNDLAILEIPVEITAKPLRFASKPAAPGDTVFAITNPQGLEKTISQGVVSGLREFQGKQLLQVSAPLSPGSSGGPIFNSEGEVVGVAVGGLREGQNLNFAVPAALARKLLESKESSAAGEATTTLAELATVRAERNKETFSPDPTSAYQKSKQKSMRCFDERSSSQRPTPHCS
jgi:S1-C subfamily serine protease